MATQTTRRLLTKEDLVVEPSVIQEAATRGDLVVVPDRLSDRKEKPPVAAYRHEVRDLRSYAKDKDIRVVLATPEGFQTASYEEHAAEWVLPLIVFASTVTTSVGCNLLSDWIWDTLGGNSDPATTVRVRHARLSADGVR